MGSGVLECSASAQWGVTRVRYYVSLDHAGHARDKTVTRRTSGAAAGAVSVAATANVAGLLAAKRPSAAG
eukprot:scaffold111694_cov66-Phaeocystis_antarctica.AAC.2